MELKYRRCANLFSSVCMLKEKIDLQEVEPGKQIPPVSYPKNFADADETCAKCEEFKEKVD